MCSVNTVVHIKPHYDGTFAATPCDSTCLTLSATSLSPDFAMISTTQFIAEVEFSLVQQGIRSAVRQ